MIKKIVYFEVHDNFSVDGMDPAMGKTIGNFFEEKVAKEFAKGRGNYKKDAHVTRQVVLICETPNDVYGMEKENLKEQALAKLSKEEREALGV
jgi:hypothetical protein